MNNIDIRQNLFADPALGLAVATDRDDNSLAFYLVDERGVTRAATPSLPAGVDINLSDEVYGICLYHSFRKTLYVICNFKSGKIFQWQLSVPPEYEITATLARRWELTSQPEGMVADDELG